jgi:biotin-(acetyl-CoA carboxylase) ligase
MIDLKFLTMIAQIGAGIGAGFLPPVVSGSITTALAGLAEAQGLSREQLLAQWDSKFNEVTKEIDQNNKVYEDALKNKPI